ncbi:MAG: DUF1330 domain-containing protein [Pseudomonadota bacterium]
MTGYIDPTPDALAAFADQTRPGPIHLLNLIRFRERAAYDDGSGMSGADAYKTYMQETAPIFARVGGRQVWLGRAELTLIGPADEIWHLAFVAEYPNVAAMRAMLQDPDYQKAARHRKAAVADSRLIKLDPNAV